MKKRICVYLLIFFAFLSHFLIPDTVFGSAEAVKTKYGGLLKKTEIHQPFINLLSAFKESELVLDSFIMERFVSSPRAMWDEFRHIDPIILGYLSGNKKFRELFRDRDFHAVVRSSDEIDELIGLIPTATGDSGDSTCPVELPKATTLSIVSGNNQSGEIGKSLAQPFVVEVRNQDGKLHQETAVTFTASGGQLSIPTEKKTGQVQINFTLGVNPGIYQIEARVARKNSLNDIQLTQRFTATAIGVALPEPTTLEIVPGSNNQMGEAGKTLAQPFVVEVKNKAGRSLSGIGVIFSVIGGGGRLSDETAITGTDGRAKATLTLGALPGENTVEVRVARSPLGTQEFTATAIARPIAQFPLLYWIEAGRLYRFGGSIKENLMPNVNNVVSFTVDMEGSKLYWAIRTAENKGKIYRANLDGTDSKKLFDPHKVPLNMAINPSDNELYWTNESGRILRAILDTPRPIEVVHNDLTSPQHIALDVSRKKMYWTEDNGDMKWMIRFAELPTGENGESKNLKEFQQDLGQLEGIAVVGDKVYWTEKINDGSRKVSCANVNGSNRIMVKILESIPLGLAFNDADSRLYWTTPHGGIQSVDLIDLAAAPSRPTVPSINSVVSVESALLANYPNPFNPETWIPYQLSASADVSVSIYAVDGRLVRRLDLGHQVAGVYRSRSRAAYWDGRNEFGERVASGLYFYTLTAGDFTATRKMLIRK